ncbi:hypothetical protein Gohar_004161, partial [Gossypium harknessii]|nr:hypothetical protein [Gossypium harknessii]
MEMEKGKVVVEKVRGKSTVIRSFSKWVLPLPMLSGFTASPMAVALSPGILFQLILQLEMAALLFLLPNPLQRS